MNASQTTPRLEEADDEPDQPPSPSCDVSDETHELSVGDLARLRESVARVVALAAGDAREHSVRVAIVGDERMSAVHRVHSDIDSTTDVLTFDLRYDKVDPLDTDVVVCLDEARRASDERGHDAVDELTLYVLHGVLHCMGYDDHDEASYEAMHRREDEILREAGIGARFFGERS